MTRSVSPGVPSTERKFCRFVWASRPAIHEGTLISFLYESGKSNPFVAALSHFLPGPHFIVLISLNLNYFAIN